VNNQATRQVLPYQVLLLAVRLSVGQPTTNAATSYHPQSIGRDLKLQWSQSSESSWRVGFVNQTRLRPVPKNPARLTASEQGKLVAMSGEVVS
jgi:hypothetical protein